MKAAFLLFTLLVSIPSHAFEMLGMLSYNIGSLSAKPPNYRSLTDGIGYTFLGRLDLGPGQLESGFQFTPTSIATLQGATEVTANGSFWILPLMYRYSFFPPFFSLGLGFDYAVVGTNNLSISGSQAIGVTSGYQSHFGAQVSAMASQDLGEDISLVLDLRYRAGLADAITYSNVGSKYNFFIIALGIQKHLE